MISLLHPCKRTILTEFRCEAVITEDSDLLIYAGVKELVSLKHRRDPSGAAELITKGMLE